MRNKGRGPAKLTKIEFRYDGNPHSRDAIAGLFLEAQQRYNIANGTDFRCSFKISDILIDYVMIQANERAVLWTTEGDCPRKKSEYQEAFLRRFLLYIEYESLTGTPYKFMFVGNPSLIPNFQEQSLFSLPRYAPAASE